MKAMISARVLFATTISTFAANPPALQPSVELTAASASKAGEHHVDIAVTEQPVFYQTQLLDHGRAISNASAQAAFK